VSFLDRLKSSGRPAPGPRAPRVRKPRVFLSREETKAINTPVKKERIIGMALAVYFEAIAVFIHLSEVGSRSDQLWRLGVMLFVGFVFFMLAAKGNRILLSIGAFICVYIPGLLEKPKIAQLFFLPAIPLYAFMLWIMLFKLSGERRKAVDARIASGDYGNPRPLKSETAKNAPAKEDATGRTIASASKRYTPPKAKPKSK
jgi:hypothetical protein